MKQLNKIFIIVGIIVILLVVIFYKFKTTERFIVGQYVIDVNHFLFDLHTKYIRYLTYASNLIKIVENSSCDSIAECEFLMGKYTKEHDTFLTNEFIINKRYIIPFTNYSPKQLKNQINLTRIPTGRESDIIRNCLLDINKFKSHVVYSINKININRVHINDIKFKTVADKLNISYDLLVEMFANYISELNENTCHSLTIEGCRSLNKGDKERLDYYLNHFMIGDQDLLLFVNFSPNMWKSKLNLLEIPSTDIIENLKRKLQDIIQLRNHVNHIYHRRLQKTRS